MTSAASCASIGNGCRRTPREVERLARISVALRKDRELYFYGDIDFIPTEQYTREHARQALAAASVVSVAATVIGSR